MKRVFGIVEVAFDVSYLAIALFLGVFLFFTGSDNPPRALAGIMAAVLVFGDAFHLVPRIKTVLTQREVPLRRALGRGKQIASITMTVFYLLLWRLAALVFLPKTTDFWSNTVYLLAAVRIFLCLLPQNKWSERYPPVNWAIIRNVPFFLLGATVAGLYFIQRNQVSALHLMWLAIILSFAFYLPVVLWSNQNPKIGMLMLPKTCTYVWILIMCLWL